MKLKKLFSFFFFSLVSFSLGTSVIYSESKTGLQWTGTVKQGSGGGPSSLEIWLPQVLNLAIGLAALVCVAVIIGSGYMYITASGDEEKVRKAGQSITYAVIGLVICVISVILVEFVLKRVLV